MKRYLDIIRMDIATMNAGKNTARSSLILLIVVFGAMGLFVSPIAGIEGAFVIAAFMVPMLFGNETKYHCEKQFCLLPVTRRDLVRARFVFTIGTFTAISTAFYLVMVLSYHLKLYTKLLEAPELVETLADAAGMQGLGLFDLIYMIVFAFGIKCLGSTLRSYFRDPSRFSMDTVTIKKSQRWEIVLGIVILGVVGVWMLILSGVLPAGHVVSLILSFLMSLAQVMNGRLLGIFLVVWSFFSVIYAYITTVIEYEKKDL